MTHFLSNLDRCLWPANSSTLLDFYTMLFKWVTMFMENVAFVFGILMGFLSNLDAFCTLIYQFYWTFLQCYLENKNFHEKCKCQFWTFTVFLKTSLASLLTNFIQFQCINISKSRRFYSNLMEFYLKKQEIIMRNSAEKIKKFNYHFPIFEAINTVWNMLFSNLDTFDSYIIKKKWIFIKISWVLLNTKFIKYCIYLGSR